MPSPLNFPQKHSFTMNYTLDTMPLRPRHYWITGVASLGQLIGTMVATIAGIIIPMLNLILHPELSGLMQGVIGGADLVGIIIGSVVFGRLSDQYGYLFFFRLCPALMCIFAIIGALAPGIWILALCLFMIGFAIGGEYSLDSDYVSELTPSNHRSLMVGVTKTASALGNIIAAGVSYGLLTYWSGCGNDIPAMWPKLMWIIAATACIMLLSRIYFFQSPEWLMSKGRKSEAEKALQNFLGKDVTMMPEPLQAPASDKQGMFAFMIKNWKKVVLSGVPWACEGLGVYGIGVFLPILVMALGLEHFSPGEAAILHVVDSVKITLYISCIILPGFITGLILINRKKSVTAIQTWGFLFCTAALAVLVPAYSHHWNKWVAIGAFMAFEFFLNMGPHLVTYVLPPKIYPVPQRGQGAGIAAAIGKIGAVLGVFCIPLLLKTGGATLVLVVSAGVMAIGAVVTYSFRAEATERAS